MTERAVRTHSHEFLWGTAISEYQVSGAVGCPHSNWADWEIQRANGSRRIARGRFSGNACDFKNKYHEYIAIMKELGTNAFRFSVEWSNVEPREGIFCAHALTYYSDFCDALINAGITPMITLHHFTDPGWFAKKGLKAWATKYIFGQRSMNPIFICSRDTCAVFFRPAKIIPF